PRSGEGWAQRARVLAREARRPRTGCAAAVRAGRASTSGDPRVLHADGGDRLPAAHRLPRHQGLRGVLPRSPVALSGRAIGPFLHRAVGHQRNYGTTGSRAYRRLTSDRKQVMKRPRAAPWAAGPKKPYGWPRESPGAIY